MDIKTIAAPLHEQNVDAVIAFLFDDNELHSAAKALDEALNGALTELIEVGDLSGEAGQVFTFYPRGAIAARRVIVVGFGDVSEFNAEALRRAAALGLKRARTLKAASVAITIAGTGRGGLSLTNAAQAIVEGGLLGLYRYQGYKSKADEENNDNPQSITLCVYDDADITAAEQGVHIGRAMAEGAAFTRDLVNLPPNVCTPPYLAQAATEMAAEVGLKITVLEKHQMEALKMGALLAVAQGSDTPPRFIILEHNAGRASELPTVVLVGKGVTFDTGGYNIKTGEGMRSMRADMGGAAAVIGAMRIIARLDIPLHVVGLAPAADNMISGNAYRPSEVITASNGKTIEIVSTDAEGRLLLADALVYAARYKPAAVVDIATLTGSCIIALGTAAAGLFSIDDTLRDKLLASGEATGERLWQLPLFPEYSKTIETPNADMLNSPGNRFAGVGASAAFLRNFVDYPAWAHIDMAGKMQHDKDNPYDPGPFASGYGARLLAEFVRSWAQ